MHQVKEFKNYKQYEGNPTSVMDTFTISRQYDHPVESVVCDRVTPLSGSPFLKPPRFRRGLQLLLPLGLTMPFIGNRNQPFYRGNISLVGQWHFIRKFSLLLLLLPTAEWTRWWNQFYHRIYRSERNSESEAPLVCYTHPSGGGGGGSR